jgi:dihydroorotate dehydrogenase (NAD+) catalytic subunit
VIGVGGIADTDDAVDFLVAGADALQVGTATFTDPSAAIRIVAGLHDHLAAAGLSRTSELRWHPSEIENAPC